MAREPLSEGDIRRTDLPMQAVMIERVERGRHFLEIERKGLIVSQVLVTNYTHWDHAFDAAMDKAGL